MENTGSEAAPMNYGVVARRSAAFASGASNRLEAPWMFRVFDIVERHQVERDGAAAERLREQAFLTTIADMGSRLMARELEPAAKKMPKKNFAFQITFPSPSSSRTIQGG